MIASFMPGMAIVGGYYEVADGTDINWWFGSFVVLFVLYFNGMWARHIVEIIWWKVVSWEWWHFIIWILLFLILPLLESLPLILVLSGLL